MSTPAIRNEEYEGTSAFNTLVECLISTLQSDVDEQYLRQLESDISQALQRGNHRRLIIDATQLQLMDATDFVRLRRTIDTAKLMGVESVLVGLRPGVVASLVELDADTRGLVTTLNLEQAININCEDN